MMPIGMDKQTGRGISGIEHIRQSVNDILTTPVGSVTMNREYGSLVPELIDHPTNGANVLRLMTATVMAVGRWEPRVTISRVGFALGDQPGQAFVDMEGYSTDSNGRSSALSLNVPLGGLR